MTQLGGRISVAEQTLTSKAEYRRAADVRSDERCEGAVPSKALTSWMEMGLVVVVAAGVEVKKVATSDAQTPKEIRAQSALEQYEYLETTYRHRRHPRRVGEAVVVGRRAHCVGSHGRMSLAIVRVDLECARGGHPQSERWTGGGEMRWR